ncbi:hypothetical protein J4460_05940 [Candidatus Woesearchaeota archaeon]|nr:hypothetical protein [Candidatus Woesearchaeota archaeon]HIH38155.1 hypothetical protein [Candidatus Woesearchaeota archaeon]HIH49406.1 hypothetical protein [Candidatus Woesearchaeota archaeon]HIJ03661.1 hypothetical protein [Candidatus Woesearchaeota archaeon]
MKKLDQKGWFAIGIVLLSAALLGFELLLPRIFSAVAGSAFIHYALAIALLGLAAGNLTVYLKRGTYAKEHKPYLLVRSCLLFGISLIISIIIVDQIGAVMVHAIDQLQLGRAMTPDLLEALFHYRFSYLMISGIFLFIPFFFGGRSIGIIITFFMEEVERNLFFNLLGSAIGCILSILLISFLDISTVFLILSFCGCIAAYSFMRSDEKKIPSLVKRSIHITLFLVILLLIVNSSYRLATYSPSTFAFRRGNNLEPHQEITYRWTPYGRIGLYTQVWSPPLNHNISLREKKFVGIDSGGHSLIEPFTKESLKNIHNTSKYSDDEIDQSIIPVILDRERKTFLVLLAGTGQDMLRLYSWFPDASIQGIDVNPAVYRFGLETGDSHLQEFFSLPNVTMTIHEARSYAEKAYTQYDLIVVSYDGASFATGSGAFTTTPQFLFTKEAYEAYLRMLSPQGVIAGGGISMSPRKIPSIVAALRSSGMDPKDHIILYRFGNTGSHGIIIYKELVPEIEVDRLYAISSNYSLTIQYHPYTNITPIVNITPDGWSTTLMQELHLEGSSPYLIGTDDWPYLYFSGEMYRFAARPIEKEKDISSFLSIMGLGYLLGGIIILTFLFFLLPLLKYHSDHIMERKRIIPLRLAHFTLVFGMIGIGWVLLELALIHKFSLYLENPLLSFSIVVASILISLAYGSLKSQKIAEKLSLRIHGILIIVLSAGVLYWTQTKMHLFFPEPVMKKILSVIILLFPLGLAIGSLFPRLLRIINEKSPEMVPFALAINSLASVFATVLGAGLLLVYGGNVTYLAGTLCYLAIALLSFTTFGDMTRWLKPEPKDQIGG